MLVRSEGERKVQIAVPTGDLNDTVTKRLRRVGLKFSPVEKKNLVSVDNLAVDMLLIRPSSVPEMVMHGRTRTRAGLTGGDIVWNWDPAKKDQGTTIPTIANESTLFVGVTKPLADRIRGEDGREPRAEDLIGSTVVTKFPRIAEDVFGGMVDIWAMPGSTEAMQYALDDAEGILDVTATGGAIRANQLTVVEKLMSPVDVRMIQQPGLSSFEERIIADFTGLLLHTDENHRYPVSV